MNRQEFCQIIADIRKQSTIKMKDVCFQMGVMPTAIYRLEKGSSNFEMGNMMSYIKALQHILVIENGQHSYRINDAQELGSILALIRKEKAISQRALAEKTGFVYSTIVKIESKKSIISIDTMLIMLVLMFPFGLLENPQKRLSKGNSAIVIIVGAGSAILLDYMYNEHYELLYKFFLAIGVIGVVIYALGISFFRTKR